VRREPALAAGEEGVESPGVIWPAKYVSRRTGITRQSGSPRAILMRFCDGSSSITVCHG